MNSARTKTIDIIALILVIIGALNWGILVVLNRELINGVFKLGLDVANIIYVIIAVSGIWCLFSVLPKYLKK
ncbi:MAG: DUF378 domain-containing protein [Candidatus Fermentibacteraceae bacterium]